MRALIVTFILVFSFAVAQEHVADAFLPYTADARIVPTPQQETQLDEGYTLTPNTVIVLAEETAALRHAAVRLQDEIQARYGFRLPLQSGAPTEILPEQIVMARVGSAWDDGTLEPVTQPEGYALRVSPNGVLILGADERGMFYGVQSLRQLLAGTPTVRGVVVRDWPELPLRAAMVYLDAHSDEINPTLLPILAAHKFNAVLIMTNYLHWDSAPALHLPQGAPKEAAERLAEVARLHLLEPIPLLETLGHVEWMFANNQNRDLLQDPTVSTPFAYDPLNPRVYEVLFPIIDEVLELFEPRYLHIGHDEVRNVIPFPATEEGRRIGFPQLFLDDTLRLYEYLGERGVRTMMWHDVLFAEDVRPLWEAFPKDISVAAWRYIPAADYPMVSELQAAGFPAYGASWFDADNITAFARSAARHHAEGMIHTRWTGYFGNRTVLTNQYPQVYAYLKAAHAFWNPHAEPLEDAPARFRRAWLGDSQESVRPGTLMDLSPHANAPLDGHGERGWLGLDAAYAPAGLLEPDIRPGGVRFHLTGAISLRGSHRRVENDPESVSLTIDDHAQALTFLHATGWAAPSHGETVGTYRVHYQDGTVDEIALQYGVNISAWTELEVRALELNQAWRGHAPNGLGVAAYLHWWDNPRPHVAIERLELISRGGLANPILFGVTLLDE